ncbi:MAG: protoporphyrinogen oxidase [Leptospirales bacterium]
MAAFDCDTIVVGGGIAGLAAAMTLKKSGQTVRLLEARGYLGGAMMTVRDQGYLLEFGPNSLIAGPDEPIMAWIRNLGIERTILPASPSAKNRFILRDGKLFPVPLSITSFLSSSLLSWKGKLRILKEWGVPPKKDGKEESLGHFVRRRFGEEALLYLVDPFVKGVYASNPDLLSLGASFPALLSLEKEYGGILRGMLSPFGKKKKSGSIRSQMGLFSFPGGVGEMVSAFESYLGDDAGMNVEVVKWASLDDGGFRAGLLYDEQEYYMTAKNLILATSASAAGELLGAFLDGTSAHLRSIPYAPLTICYLGFPKERVSHLLNGFGILCPTTENRKILGIIFSSSLFPDRAPEGKVLLTVFVGGMNGQKLANAFDEDLERIVMGEVQDLLGISGAPDFIRFQRWERAIPQYVLGHGERIRAIRSGLPPHLRLAGNYMDGVSVAKTFASGVRAAEEILSS